MPETLSKESVTRSIQTFKDRRDAVVGGESGHFGQHLDHFIAFCKSNDLVCSVIEEFEAISDVNPEELMLTVDKTQRIPLPPDNINEEMCMLWKLTLAGAEDDNFIFRFGVAFHGENQSAWINHFRSLVVRPFIKEMGRRLGDAAKMAPPEARDLQAVPHARIPSENEVGIFLSHRDPDKPLVRRYYHALKELGYSSWLDEKNMAAGSNLERDLQKGFEESCAAVFFITENFKDEKFIASEIDYARIQKRKKGDKFSIITLLFDENASVPGLLEPYVWMHVDNDLEGFYELIRGLPLELGAARWKANVV